MDEGGGAQKMSVFVHAQGIKTVHAGGGVKKWQNSVHVIVERPLIKVFLMEHILLKPQMNLWTAAYLLVDDIIKVI